MQSSQMSMINRTGILISTAYESLNNPMTQEVEYAEKVLDGVIEDDTLFALLYKPDNPKDWLSDKSLLEANPLCFEVPENLEYLKKQRTMAIEMPEAKKNFLTKHMNIFTDGDDSEVYIPMEDFRKCAIKNYDWCGRDVYVGVDLSLTTDTTSISMVTYDVELGKFVAKSWAFIPKDNAHNKSKVEKVDYFLYKDKGYCFHCGDNVIDHNFVEEFVMSLAEKYGVNILDIGYDRYNCIASATRWYNAGYQVTEIKQHSSVLHAPTKFLKECVLKGEFAYEENKLLEIHFSNARCVYDNNLNAYINKKKSSGKIDMAASTINAMVFWEKEFAEGRNIYDTNERSEGFIFL